MTVSQPSPAPARSVGSADKALYISAIDPGLLGAAALLPSRRQWRAGAAAGFRGELHDLVRAALSWARLALSGWRPRDPRAVVEEVTRFLPTTVGLGHDAVCSVRRIALVLQLGSATHHLSYSTVLVEEA